MVTVPLLMLPRMVVQATFPVGPVANAWPPSSAVKITDAGIVRAATSNSVRRISASSFPDADVTVILATDGDRRVGEGTYVIPLGGEVVGRAQGLGVLETPLITN